jgi:hypothetical protein
LPAIEREVEAALVIIDIVPFADDARLCISGGWKNEETIDLLSWDEDGGWGRN